VLWWLHDVRERVACGVTTPAKEGRQIAQRLVRHSASPESRIVSALDSMVEMHCSGNCRSMLMHLCQLRSVMYRWELVVVVGITGGRKHGGEGPLSPTSSRHRRGNEAPRLDGVCPDSHAADGRDGTLREDIMLAILVVYSEDEGGDEGQAGSGHCRRHPRPAPSFGFRSSGDGSIERAIGGGRIDIRWL
jgi:hypothetical protein